MTKSERQPSQCSSTPIVITMENLHNAVVALNRASVDFKKRSQKGMTPARFHTEARVLVCASIALNNRLDQAGTPTNRNINSISGRIRTNK